MRSRSLALLLGVVLVAALFLVFTGKSKASPSPADAQAIAAKILGNPDAQAPVPSAPSAAPTVPQVATVSAESPSPLKVVELMPSREALRSAVAANPHSPPEIMVRFTLELYAKQQEALKSQSNAERFFRELEDCVVDRDGTEQAKALCLINAKRLQDKYSSLSHDFDRLQSQASPEAARLLHLIE